MTHAATGYYNYTACTDQTIVGVWKRAPIIMRSNYPPSPVSTKEVVSDQNTTVTTATTTNATTTMTRKANTRVVVPMMKMVVTKTVLLRDMKTRKDYFSQQKAFLRQEHPDEYAEFSTNVYLNHLESQHSRTISSPRILALRPSKAPLSDDSSSSSSDYSNTVFHWPSLQQRWLVHRYTYWFFTGIGMTVPYRRWLASQCDEVRVRVVKETSMEKSNFVSPTDGTKNPSWFSTSLKS